MDFIREALRRTQSFAAVENNLKPDKPICATGLSDIHKSIIIYSLCRDMNVRAFCAVSDEQKAQTMCNDLCSMGLRAYFYPTRDFIFREISGKSRDFEHQRLNVLYKMLGGDYDVIIACADAACQYTIPPEHLSGAVLELSVGAEVSTERCLRALTLLGYQRFDQVDGKGQFSLRGDILDFFMPDSDNPVRAEFWGDEITALNYFDLESQRRVEKADKITLTPSAEIIIENKDELADKINKKASLLKGKNQQAAKEILLREAQKIRDGLSVSSIDKFIGEVYEKPATLLDYLGSNDIVFVSEYGNVRERAKALDFQFNDSLVEYFKEGTLCRGFETFSLPFNSFMEELKHRPSLFMDTFASGSYDFPLSELVSFNVKQNGLWNGSLKYITDDLESYRQQNCTAVILAGTEKAADNLYENLRKEGFPAQPLRRDGLINESGIFIMPGALSAGFEIPEAKFVLISQGL